MSPAEADALLLELRAILNRRAAAKLARDAIVREADAQLAASTQGLAARQDEIERTILQWAVENPAAHRSFLVHGELTRRAHPERVEVKDPHRAIELARYDAPEIVVTEVRLDLRRMAKLAPELLARLGAVIVRGESIVLTLPEGHTVALTTEATPCPPAP